MCGHCGCGNSVKATIHDLQTGKETMMEQDPAEPTHHHHARHHQHVGGPGHTHDHGHRHEHDHSHDDDTHLQHGPHYDQISGRGDQHLSVEIPPSGDFRRLLRGPHGKRLPDPLFHENKTYCGRVPPHSFRGRHDHDEFSGRATP